MKSMPRIKSLHLTKSKFLSGLQCLKKLYFSVHSPGLASDPDKSQQFQFDQGHEIGRLAQKCFPGGILIESEAWEHEEAVNLTKKAMDNESPAIYEAAFEYKDIRIRVDILEKVKGGYKLIEVKSSTMVKEVHIFDAAIQTYVLQGLGIPLRGIFLMTINRNCVIPNWKDLFVLNDLKSQVNRVIGNIPDWLSQERQALNRPKPPELPVGNHCTDPYVCEFWDICTQGAPKHPIWEFQRFDWKDWAKEAESKNWAIKDQHDKNLNPTERRQKECIESKKPWVTASLATALKRFAPPAHYLDFETTSLVVLLPFNGYHPYDTVPFQFSSLYINAKGKERVINHLHKTTEDPVPALAEALIQAVKEPGPIVVYNKSFESRVISEMARALPKLRKKLLALVPRLLDLLPLVRKSIYHPDFHGSFSLKDVYPALCENSKEKYTRLPIASGVDASLRYVDSLHPKTSVSQRNKIHRDLVRYCSLDSKATYLVQKALQNNYK